VREFDVLRLSLKRGVLDEAMISINGRSLLDMIREVEAPFATAEGSPRRAGSYRALPADVAFLPSRHLLDDVEPIYSDAGWTGEVAKPAVLICVCGEPGCNPLCVRIDVQEDVVVWHDFQQPHRVGEGQTSAWSYQQIGPFTFQRRAYERALRRPE
jgi:hypothetical protein